MQINIGCTPAQIILHILAKSMYLLSYRTMPFSSPPATTLTDIPSGWFENATQEIISLQCTCPIRSPFTVQSLRSLPPPTRKNGNK